MPRFLLVLVLLAATGCNLRTSNQVILATNDGTRKLIYDCSNFLPQVETGEQRQCLRRYPWPVWLGVSDGTSFFLERSLNSFPMNL